MFGVALSIKPEHFYKLVHTKKALFTGLISQYLLLPIITCLLIVVLRPLPGIALGMILVACCPGGNVSNFFTSLSKGNIALSVTLTAFTSLLAFIITPASFLFWASLIPDVSSQLKELEIEFIDLFLNMIGILLLPLIAGMLFNKHFPALAEKITKPVRMASILILLGFILVTLYFNSVVFQEYIMLIFWLVMLHNGLALAGGFSLSYLIRNQKDTHRAVSIETGIQNSGLALVLIFTFFNGNGFMALVAAWWGVWHLISGFTVAYFYSRNMVQHPS
jgi:bile acid:Na+ symporter, BASS family